MITENVSTLKIHKLTQAQYDRELAAGNIDENALYLTPDEEIDLSGYATVEELNMKADAEHSHDDLATIANVDELKDEVNELSSTVAGKLDTATAQSTYETKTDAQTKLDEAKGYAEELASDKASQSDLTALQGLVGNTAVSEQIDAAVTPLRDEMNDALDSKADSTHDHNDLYYTQEQIDTYKFITTDDIDTICGSVSEGGLPESDIDELMSKLEEA